MESSGSGIGKVLIVDDNPMNVMILEEILEEFELQSANDGAESLQTLDAFRPDLVVLDVMMPGMDGYEVCQWIKAHDTLASTRVLFVSAKAMTSEIEKGYEVGGDGYISKPFDHADLLAQVRKLVAESLGA